MWQEARKHEKKIKGMMVDFKRRAERRRDFYEKIRKDPAQFLQVHGRQLKVHIDGNISQAAEQCLVPWAADANTLIDRFDARAYLDRLPEDSSVKEKSHGVSTSLEERDSNYERWKNLVQNEFLSNPETKVLAHIANEESGKFEPAHVVQQNAALKKKLIESKATIGYNYDDGDAPANRNSKTVESEESSSDEVDSDIDCDSTVNIDHLSHEDGIKLNSLSLKFGMKGEDFTRNLENDKVEAERLKLAKEIENEKSKFSGRKSRRDRKILNPKRMLIMRTTNNTSEEKIKKEESSSSSESEKESYVAPKIEFITSFGQSSNEEDTTVKEKVKESKPNKLKNLRRAINKDETQTKIEFGPSISSSSRRNKSRERDHVSHRPRTKTSHHESSGHQRRRKNSSSRSRSRDRSPRKNSSRERTSHRHRSARRDRSRSRSRYDRNRRSRSRSLDMFGRDKTRRQDSSNSSKRNSPVDTSRQVKIKPETSISALPATEVLTTKPESSSPPRKLYYRRDLLSDKSDASGDEQTSFSKEYQRDEATATHEKVNELDRSTQKSKLMRRTRTQIDKLYKLDKKAEQEKKVVDRKQSSRERRRSWSTSSSD